jgi:NADH:ubiquinone oxidoreductase subunit
VSAKGLVHKGQNITGKGSIVFEKREKGWVSIAVKGLPTDEMTYQQEMKKSHQDNITNGEYAKKLPKEASYDDILNGKK